MSRRGRLLSTAAIAVALVTGSAPSSALAAESDAQPPVLESFSFSPREVDPAAGPTIVTVRLTVSDPSKVRPPKVLFRNPKTGQRTAVVRASLIDGTRRQGVWQAEVTIPQGASPGIWKAKLKQLRDGAGNAGPAGPSTGHRSLIVASKSMDTDGDGLVDYDEVKIHRTDPLILDTDGDGFGDGEEIGSASNPKDRLSIPGCDLGPGIDLTACPEVRNETLAGVDLTGAVLDGMNLQAFDFTDTNLAGASLVGADVADATFVRTDLTGTDLTTIDCGDIASFRSVVVDDARLGNQAGCYFWFVDFRRAIVLPNSSFGSLGNVTFRNMNVPGLTVSGFHTIQDSNFSYANLVGARLAAHLDMVRVDFSHADLTGVAFAEGTNNDSLDFTGAILAGGGAANAEFTNSSFTSAVMTGMDLSGASLVGSDLTGADLTGVIWSFTTCPDGSNSDDADGDGFTCEGNRTP